MHRMQRMQQHFLEIDTVGVWGSNPHAPTIFIEENSHFLFPSHFVPQIVPQNLDYQLPITVFCRWASAGRIPI
jgi:hypothetical protein